MKQSIAKDKGSKGNLSCCLYGDSILYQLFWVPYGDPPLRSLPNQIGLPSPQNVSTRARKLLFSAIIVNKKNAKEARRNLTCEWYDRFLGGHIMSIEGDSARLLPHVADPSSKLSRVRSRQRALSEVFVFQ
jgi:hypothetical protein